MLRQMLTNLRRDKSGATSIEFAILVLPFLAVLFACVELSIKSLTQSALDYQVFTLAQHIARNTDASIDKVEFKKEVVCNANLSSMLDCNKLAFGADAFKSDRSLWKQQNKHFVNRWRTGCAGSTVIVEMLYPVTHFTLPFAVADVVKYKGKDHYRARGLIRREPLTVGTGKLNGGGTCA